MTIREALKTSLLGLLASKKAMLGLLTLLAMLGARYGLGFSAEHALELISPLIAVVVGQGIADHGQGQADAATTNARLQAALALAATPLEHPAADDSHQAAHAALRELAAS